MRKCLKGIPVLRDCCCYMPSETYGRNGVTPIFRSFHRTASITVSFLEDAILFLQGLLFFSFCVHFVFFASALCMCVIYLTSFDVIF